MSFIKTLSLSFLVLFSISTSSQSIIDSTNFIFIEGGNFVPGSSSGDFDEKGGKKTKVNSYYLSKYEVNNSEFCMFLNKAKIKEEKIPLYINLKGKNRNIESGIYKEGKLYKIKKGYENQPVSFVSWFGAYAFCQYTKTRLPSEIEWEYAAKGGIYGCKTYKKKKNEDKCYIFSGGNSADSVAWFKENSENSIHNSGLKKDNALGLFDMSGNLSEWCYDSYSETYYSELKRKSQKYNEKGALKVHRGGSWANSQKTLRLPNRRASNPYSRNATIGFRIAKD